MQIAVLDWIIIGLYLLSMILLSVYLSRGQKNQKDYYLGGNSFGAFPTAMSIMASQCSTNSILGAPAFVAFAVGGGMVWLQYELAVPVAMVFLMIFVLPVFKKKGVISIYQYLGDRFGASTRIALSVLFQLLRAFATGVIIYGVSHVIAFCTGISFFWSVIVLGIITIVYDTIGGMKAVILSDVIQMIILYASILFVIFISIDLLGGFSSMIEKIAPERLQAVDFDNFGVNGNDFAFWPMFFGGVFLYIAYYGFDQTQVQRQLSTRDTPATLNSLYLNGLLRFPLVLTYLFLGICLGAYTVINPEFYSSLPDNESGGKIIDLALPVFVESQFAPGFVGLFFVGLFSAAMSSLDSTINSLSATTMQDIIKDGMKLDVTEKQELWISKGLTVFWGTTCMIFAFYVGGISDSIIVSINKISSLANGPILGVFLLGLFTKRTNNLGALAGLIAGFLFNLMLWVYFPNISWLWWNLTGFIVTFFVGVTTSSIAGAVTSPNIDQLTYNKAEFAEYSFSSTWKPKYLSLLVYAGVILTLLVIAF
ncbi:MAG: sodium/solute symporter [Bacteroidota bacterium]